jgi:hypothetical protein
LRTGTVPPVHTMPQPLTFPQGEEDRSMKAGGRR